MQFVLGKLGIKVDNSSQTINAYFARFEMSCHVKTWLRLGNMVATVHVSWYHKATRTRARTVVTLSSQAVSGTGMWVRCSTIFWLRLCMSHTSSRRVTLLVLEAASLWSSAHDRGSRPLTGLSNLIAGSRSTTGPCPAQKSLSRADWASDAVSVCSEVLFEPKAAIFLYKYKARLQEVTVPEEEGFHERGKGWVARLTIVTLEKIGGCLFK